MTDCLTEQQLENLAAAAEDDPDAEGLRVHLNTCTDCREALEECRANFAFVARFAGALPKSGQAGRSSRANGGADGPRELDAGCDLPRVDAMPGYTLIREIHRGGQGVVYEAIQRSTRRTVALKIMLEGPFASERARWRFEREVRLIASLRHPNIVVVHDSGMHDGRHYFAMDFIQGRPLDEYVRFRKLLPREMAGLLHSVCDAVSYAHRRGVMHRDLKPSNILVTDDGTPYVLDFGLAKVTGDEALESHGDLVSLAGHLMGTLRYMSPEQTSGKPDEVDIRTDVYSLGVILYELLTDSAPYETAKADITTAIRNIREADPPRITRKHRHIGSELEAIVLKAMEKNPQRRYQSAGELSQDLGAWLDGRPVTAKSASSLYVLRKLAARHWYHTTIAACLGIIVIAFGTVQVHGFFKQTELRQERDRIAKAYLSWSGQETAALRAGQRSAFGWFLLEWHAGHNEQARKLRTSLPPGSPEDLAAEFLLEPACPVEKLMARMPPRSSQLAHFVVGERAVRDGRTAEAIQAFREAAQAARHAGTDGLIHSFALARLQQLGAETAENAAHNGQPDSRNGG